MIKPSDLIGISPPAEIHRRDALKLLAAGLAALEAGCLTRAGDEDIVPYVADPPELRPGVTTRYASALQLDGFGTGVIVECHEGRPTKLDGNPAHPASLGGSQPWMQARMLDLYDPQRSRDAVMRGAPASRDDVIGALRTLPPGPLWLVVPPQSSPTFATLLDRLRARREIHVVYHAPLDRRAAYRGAELAFGQALEQLPDFARADVIAAFDRDVMAAGAMAPAHARAIAARRTPSERMARLWVCEPMHTPTGTLADERLAVPAGDVAAVLACVAGELVAHGVAVPRLADDTLAAAQQRLGARAAWARELAADLAAHRGAGAIVVGDRQPAAVHALGHAIDAALGNPIGWVRPALIAPHGERTLVELASALRGRAAAGVLVIDCDPVYHAPRGLELAEALAAAPLSVHVGLYRDATAQACLAHQPLAHELETWNDPRAADGTLAIGQPAILPRFPVLSALDVLATLLGDTRDARLRLRDQLRALDDPTWTTALRTGVVAGSAEAPVTAAARWPAAAAAELAAAVAPRAPGTIELALAPSPQLHDGRFAANAWLQELPHPITKQTWGNAAIVSETTAGALGVDDGDALRIMTSAGEIVLPAAITAGTADDSITIELGHGQHARQVPVANEVGASGYELRDGDAMILRGLAARGTGSIRIVRTQHVFTQHEVEVVPTATLRELLGAPVLAAAAGLRGAQASLLPEAEDRGLQWGMSIDTSICTGCSACMVACQAENNIATVGPDNVAVGRHMNWLRIDRYVVDGGGVVNEPLPCQHCENAPCEYVCPVNATTHSADGLNEQIYNRCIGTRFCSNNCPYKVRRFNWFAFESTDSRALQYNPDVTVRSRGVMEKCTYCVQRIRGAEHAALVEHRAIRPGEVVTACQAACPTGAIQFGMLHETGTAFAHLRRDPRRFEVLHDLGTRPRTQYLAKIINPKERA